MKIFFNAILNRSFLMKLMIKLVLVMVISCKEEPVGQQPTDTEAPSPVSNLKVQPTPGGAIISYDIPNESDISYVLCEYVTDKGEKKVTRSSIYQNQVEVEGLGEVIPVHFTLSLVDHSQNKSKPVTGTFSPEEPNFKTVFKTIEITPDFSGIVLNWKNENKDLLGFFIYAINDDGKWEEKALTFSSKETDRRSLRGFDTKDRKFGVQIMDRFGHKTDTLVVSRTPLFEKMLDKKKFKDGYLAGDNNTNHSNRPLSNIWDDKVNVIWHTVPNAGFTMPETFTIDLGVDALLSRMVMWNRLDYSYGQHNPRYIEVWGSNTLSHDRLDNYWKTDAWKDKWTLLGDFEQIKPSGLPYGQTTNEDKAIEQAGFEFIFEPGAGKMRYLRFVVKETWQKTAAIHFGELSIFGDDTAQ